MAASSDASEGRMSAEIELLAQVGAGADGVAFRARLAGDEVEYRSLAPLWADPAHRDAVSKRLRLARLLDHPAARRVRRLDLDRAFVVLDPPAGPPLAEHLAGKLPLPPIEAVALALDVAAVLQAAHRLGLGHGRLSPRSAAACPAA